ncbi:hypothetical protein CDD82_7660 [Ophiocordyceps australis]|uniref:Secreted protein n=1 Tax=Ophiocordyceps australis TaxID=1399860 RepID=A0A2C5YRP2_9HYPO|nr:hypothetical protein CDD82_7660 [Ophiocordyceps australis]
MNILFLGLGLLGMGKIGACQIKEPLLLSGCTNNRCYMELEAVSRRSELVGQFCRELIATGKSLPEKFELAFDGEECGADNNMSLGHACECLLDKAEAGVDQETQDGFLSHNSPPAKDDTFLDYWYPACRGGNCYLFLDYASDSAQDLRGFCDMAESNLTSAFTFLRRGKGEERAVAEHCSQDPTLPLQARDLEKTCHCIRNSEASKTEVPKDE